MAVDGIMWKSLYARCNSIKAVKFCNESNGNSLKRLWSKFKCTRLEAIDLNAVVLTSEIMLFDIAKKSTLVRPVSRVEDTDVSLLYSRTSIFKLTVSANIPSGSVFKLFLDAVNFISVVIPLKESTDT